MTTTATLPDREAEERETRSAVSMIVIVPPHDSRTTVSTQGQPGCHMEVSERRSRSRSICNGAVGTIEATSMALIAMTGAASGYRSPGASA
jgi:hypothetical protein